MRQRGFTLIELLVVIAIIAILAAILFPVFARAREKARQITCASNMKQIDTAILMYVQDYDETYPFAGFWPWWFQGDNGATIGSNNPYPGCLGWPCILPDGHATFAARLMPYLKSYDVWVCPSADNGPVNTGSGWVGQASKFTVGAGQKPISYWYSAQFHNCPLGLVDEPANRGILGETGRRRNAYDLNSGLDGYARASKWPDYYRPHSGGTNIGFADGHVKWYNDSGMGPGTDTTDAGRDVRGLPHGNICANPPKPGIFEWRFLNSQSTMDYDNAGNQTPGYSDEKTECP